MDIFYKLLTFVFSERCPYCNKLIEAKEIACPECFERLRQKHAPISGGAGGFRCLSSFVYGGRVRSMIIKIKFRDRVQYIPQAAVIMADDIRSQLPVGEIDLITCVPMHEKDFKNRGYNQSQLLAQELGKLLSVPYFDALEKVKRTKKQHRLSYAKRKTNLRGAFRVADSEFIKGKNILIIDDIVTSGYTLFECCKTLSKAEPGSVCCATIARAGNAYPKDTII